MSTSSERARTLVVQGGDTFTGSRMVRRGYTSRGFCERFDSFCWLWRTFLIKKLPFTQVILHSEPDGLQFQRSEVNHFLLFHRVPMLTRSLSGPHFRKISCFRSQTPPLFPGSTIYAPSA